MDLQMNDELRSADPIPGLTNIFPGIISVHIMQVKEGGIFR
jgi:hypothetical protein